MTDEIRELLQALYDAGDRAAILEVLEWCENSAQALKEME